MSNRAARRRHVQKRYKKGERKDVYNRLKEAERLEAEAKAQEEEEAKTAALANAGFVLATPQITTPGQDEEGQPEERTESGIIIP